LFNAANVQEYKLLRDGRISRLTEERVQLLNALEFVWEAQRGGSCKRKNMEGSSDDGETSSDEGQTIAAPTHPESKMTTSQPSFVDHVGNVGGLASGISTTTATCSGAGSTGKHSPRLSHSNPQRFGNFPFAPTLIQHRPLLRNAENIAQYATVVTGGKSVTGGHFLATPPFKFPENAKPVIVYCHNTGSTDPDGHGEFVQTAQGFQSRQEIYRTAARNAVSLHQARRKQAQEMSAQEQERTVVVEQDQKEDHNDAMSTALLQSDPAVAADKICSSPCDLVASSTAHDLQQQQQHEQKQQLRDLLEQNRKMGYQPDFVFTVPSKTGKFTVSKTTTNPVLTPGGKHCTVPKIDTQQGKDVTTTTSQVASSVDADIFDDADDDDGVRISYT
jgi:hypothetical protein